NPANTTSEATANENGTERRMKCLRLEVGRLDDDRARTLSHLSDRPIQGTALSRRSARSVGSSDGARVAPVPPARAVRGSRALPRALSAHRAPRIRARSRLGGRLRPDAPPPATPRGRPGPSCPPSVPVPPESVPPSSFPLPERE